MSFSVTYGGVAVPLETPEVHDWVEQNMSLSDLTMFAPDTAYPGTDLLGVAYPRYPLDGCKLYTWYYPTGASRWGHFSFIATTAQYDSIVPLAYSSGGAPVSRTFSMVQGSVGLSTSMYLLPPRPLVKVAGMNGLYLCTLVDERWFWQWKDIGSISVDDSTTWDEYIADVTGAMGISLSTSISGDYGYVHQKSDLANVYQSAPLCLDAALFNVGQTFIRRLGGTYAALTSAQGDTAFNAAVSGKSLIAGGDVSANVSVDTGGFSKKAMGALMPNQVVVVFRKFIQGVELDKEGPGYRNADRGHVPYTRNQGDVYTVTIALNTLTFNGLTFQGFSGSKTFLDTAEAYLDDYDSLTPNNVTELHTLATAIATDYYRHQFHGADYVWPSLLDVSGQGHYDVAWTFSLDACQTRAQRKPYNYGVEQFSHHLPGLDAIYEFDVLSASGATGGCLNLFTRTATYEYGKFVKLSAPISVSGLSATKTVVVDFDAVNCTFTTETWTFCNGLLVSAS